MEFAEVVKKVRNYEIRIRKAVNNQMHGNFTSIFKGSGLEFDDIRTYQYGDDVRRIDWNTSAKGHGTFIKTFKEEKDQIVFFIVDVSGSLDIGRKGRTKMDVALETTGVLALSAIQEGSQAGMMVFSDMQEGFVKPGNGKKHAFHLLKKLFSSSRNHKKTDLSKAFVLASTLLKKRSIVFVVSDFIDEDYYLPLSRLALKHDVVAIHIADKKEFKVPSIGLVPVLDAETGRKRWVNTALNPKFRTMANHFRKNKIMLMDLCRKNNINYLELYTDSNLVEKLISLFQVRKYRR